MLEQLGCARDRLLAQSYRLHPTVGAGLQWQFATWRVTEQLKAAAAAAFDLEEQLLEGSFRWADWEGEALAARMRGEDAAATVTMEQFCAVIEALFERKYPEVEKK